MKTFNLILTALKFLLITFLFASKTSHSEEKELYLDQNHISLNLPKNNITDLEFKVSGQCAQALDVSIFIEGFGHSREFPCINGQYLGVFRLNKTIFSNSEYSIVAVFRYSGEKMDDYISGSVLLNFTSSSDYQIANTL